MQKKTIWDMGRVSLEAFRTMDKMPVVVVLDNIRSLNNIGSVFRTSDGFAAGGCAGYAAFERNVFRRNAGIVHDD
ncbi:MAG: hypothetical protein K2F79_05675, partial [Muribaculaceae bacterium]|nr:hypothetical protein [Muribaculaceae bacterium]